MKNVNIMNVNKGDKLVKRRHESVVVKIDKTNPFHIEITCVNHLNEIIWNVFKSDQMLLVK
jgi:hypothetical protein